MNHELYKKISSFIKDHAVALMQDEKKESTPINWPKDNFIKYHKPGSSIKYFCVATNAFKSIIIDYNTLAEIAKEKPEKFGTGIANDIIEAILDSNNHAKSRYGDRVNDFSQFLSKAHSYLVQVCEQTITQKMLRIDLFRTIKDDEFIGGLFHSFKHFSIDDINLSTGNEKTEIGHTLKIIDYAKEAFFNLNEEKTHKGFNSQISFNEEYNLKFCFYKNLNTETYFINTIHKKKKKKKLTNL